MLHTMEKELKGYICLETREARPLLSLLEALLLLLSLLHPKVAEWWELVKMDVHMEVKAVRGQ